MKMLLKGGLLPVLATGVLGVPSLAAAQSLSGEAEARTGLEEIVVTARKREENLQTTPVSVTAFSEAALQARQIETVTDVGRFTPNVDFERGASLAGSSNAVTIFIRGVGQSDFNLTIDPGVAVYLDGVYISRSLGALFDTANVEQIQVLRGPQGTLFGKNTIGGAILVTSKGPSDHFEADIAATTGSFNRADIKGSINIPVSDSLSVRASGALLTRDGHMRRLIDGGRSGNQNTLSGRVVASWEAADNLTFTMSADGTRSNEEGPPIKLLQINEAAFFPTVHNQLLFGATCARGVAGRETNPNCYTSQWLTDSFYTNNNSERNRSTSRVWGTSLTVDWKTDFANIRTITAYRRLKNNGFVEGDGAPLKISGTANDYRQRQFSQEIQLSNSAFDDRLDWLFGIYYLKEKGEDINTLTWSIGSLHSGGKVDNDSYAAFTQNSFKITPRMSLTLGLRYTHEVKRFLPDQFISALVPAAESILAARGSRDIEGGRLTAGDILLPNVEVSTSVDRVNPQVTLDYKFSPYVFGYLTYSQGFKSGGFTQRVFPPLPVTPSFEPEKVDNYEAGVKLELFDRKLRLNLAAFLLDYRNLQVVVTNFVAPIITNAGKVRSQGFEGEVEAALTPGWRINGSFGYTDAYYKERPVNARVGDHLAFTPKWTASAGTSLTLFETGQTSLALRGDWSYKSANFKDAPNTPVLRQKGFSLVNISAELVVNENLSFSTGVTNLTKTKYFSVGYADLTGSGGANAIVGRPREWFLSARYSF